MIKQIIFCALGIGCMRIGLFAQTDVHSKQFFIQPLSIGNTISDLTFTNVLNYPTSTIRLSDFKGKLVIFDFWATWCSPCIKALPILDSIQGEFKKDVQIFVVGYEPTSRVRSFLQQNTIANRVKLPFITADSVLRKLFPHHTIPHEVWIDKSGKVRAITDAEYVTIENIRSIIADTSFTLPEKKDVLNYTSRKPLLENGNGGEDNLLLYRGLLTKYIEGLFSGVEKTISTESTTIRLSYINYSLLNLYYTAGMKELPYANRLILKVSDQSRYIDTTHTHIEWNEWAKKNVYCYEITVPVSTPATHINALMLQDLNKILNLNGRIENRLVQCFALIRTSNNDGLLKSKGGTPVEQLYEPLVKRLQNKPLSRLIDALNNQIPGQPIKPIIIDETGYVGMVDLNLNVDNFDSFSTLRAELKRYGLDIVPFEKVIPVFVITEKSHQY